MCTSNSEKHIAMSSSDLLGVVILARHGDREVFYQDPTTYTASETVITPLGTEQEFLLGQLLRSIYLNESSPSWISGVNNSIVNLTQIEVRADDGAEGNVVVSSAIALIQGLFPANSKDTTLLANGSTIQGPLDGYQYVKIESVEPDNDVSLEGYTSCGTFNNATTAFYNSPAFQQKANENAAFLNSLAQYVDGKPVNLQNIWNIFDFMNVQSIHNASFKVPDKVLAQVRDLANYHEYGVFTSPDLSGIGNVAGQTILPSILNGFNSIVNASDPLKLVYEAISYKPFLSLFNMTGVAAMNPQLAGIVNYAAAVAFEVRSSPSGPVVRFQFKNGTDDAEFKTYNFLNASGDVPLPTFVNYLSPVAINTLPEWCTACGNTQDRGCGPIAAAAAQGNAAARVHQPISSVGAGFLGAGLTLFVALAVIGVLVFLGVLTIGRKRSTRSTRHSEGSETSSDRKV